MVFRQRVTMMRAKLCLVIAILGLLVLPVIACNSTSTPTATPPNTEEPAPSSLPAVVGPEEPVLPTTLTRGCSPSAGGNFDNAGLAIGEMAVNFALKDTQGNEYILSRLLSEKPVVMVFGSFT